jgi:N5-(cytidine 5'-diphosphoramidyl)-L-glutamine hydrolase
MKKIVITQRVAVNKYNSIVDTIEHDWIEFLDSLNLSTFLVSNKINNIHDFLDHVEPDGIIFTGGDDIVVQDYKHNHKILRDKLEEGILKWLMINKSIPLLGVCRGMQVINNFLNGHIINVEGHTQPHKITFCDNLFFKAKTKMVNSFHNNGISNKSIGENLSPFAMSDDGNIEALSHNSLKWVGIMWHPERKIFQDNMDRDFLKTMFGN